MYFVSVNTKMQNAKRQEEFIKNIVAFATICKNRISANIKSVDNVDMTACFLNSAIPIKRTISRRWIDERIDLQQIIDK